MPIFAKIISIPQYHAFLAGALLRLNRGVLFHPQKQSRKKRLTAESISSEA